MCGSSRRPSASGSRRRSRRATGAASTTCSKLSTTSSSRRPSRCGDEALLEVALAVEEPERPRDRADDDGPGRGPTGAARGRRRPRSSSAAARRPRSRGASSRSPRAGDREQPDVVAAQEGRRPRRRSRRARSASSAARSPRSPGHELVQALRHRERELRVVDVGVDLVHLDLRRGRRARAAPRTAPRPPQRRGAPDPPSRAARGRGAARTARSARWRHSACVRSRPRAPALVRRRPRRGHDLVVDGRSVGQRKRSGSGSGSPVDEMAITSSAPSETTWGMPSRPAISSRSGPAGQMPPASSSASSVVVTSSTPSTRPVVDQLLHRPAAGAGLVEDEHVVAELLEALARRRHARCRDAPHRRRDQRLLARRARHRLRAPCPASAPAALAMIRDEIRLIPATSTTECIIVTSVEPT